MLHQVKRIEIVVDSLDFPSLLVELNALGVHDYTAMKGVLGRGNCGERGGDPFSGAFDKHLRVARLSARKGGSHR